MSCCSFLIPPLDVIPARTGLLVINFLAMINILNAVTSNSPKSANGGLTAIEIWLWTCNLFVFAALAEWVTANYNCLLTWIDLPKSTIISFRYSYMLWHKRLLIDSKDTEEVQLLRETLKKVDLGCVLAFPIAFALFNIVFWSTFL